MIFIESFGKTIFIAIGEWSSTSNCQAIGNDQTVISKILKVVIDNTRST